MSPLGIFICIFIFYSGQYLLFSCELVNPCWWPLCFLLFAVGTWPSSTHWSSGSRPRRPKWSSAWSGCLLSYLHSRSTTTPTWTRCPAASSVTSIGQNTPSWTSRKCKSDAVVNLMEDGGLREKYLGVQVLSVCSQSRRTFQRVVDLILIVDSQQYGFYVSHHM